MTGPGAQVRLEPAGTAFTVAPGESVLDAALRQGVALRYGCRHGNCSTCKYLLIDGEVDHGAASPYSLSETEREDGWALLCCARPLEDLAVADEQPRDPYALPVLTPVERTATVLAVTPLGGSLVALRVRLDAPLDFYAGQFVELGVPGAVDVWRSYSIASPPAQAQELEFVVKRIPGGAFSGRVDEALLGQELALRGPYGTGYLRAGDRDVLLVCVGSGIAPVLSILRHAADTGDRRDFRVAFGARDRATLAVLEPLVDLRVRLALTVSTALSEPDGDWPGRVGRVTQIVQHEVGDASTLDAYLCGMPAMCDTVALLLEAKGAREGAIRFDRFFPADEALPALRGS